MSLDLLRTEILDDPLTEGYFAMTVKQIRASLLAENRPREVGSVTGQDIFEAVVPGHYTALSAENKQLFGTIVGMGEIKVSGTNTKAALAAMFSGATATLDALAALQTVQVSRLAELGIPVPALSDIEKVRS